MRHPAPGRPRKYQDRVRFYVYMPAATLEQLQALSRRSHVAVSDLLLDAAMKQYRLKDPGRPE